MTDRDAMLAAICEHPADDTPRLVYADRCEEEWGEPERAAFIRVKEPHWPCVGLKEAANEFAALMGMPGEFGSDHGWCGGTKAKWTWRHGFIDSIRCNWADFLRVESRLIWVPGGTVECPECKGRMTRATQCGMGHTHYVDCHCGTGRIPRPFVPSMQPITRCEITVADAESGWTEDRGDTVVLDGHRFTRLNCEKCGGRGVWMPNRNVPYDLPCECHGQPLNEWTCDDWPVTFAMPEA